MTDWIVCTCSNDADCVVERMKIRMRVLETLIGFSLSSNVVRASVRISRATRAHLRRSSDRIRCARVIQRSWRTYLGLRAIFRDEEHAASVIVARLVPSVRRKLQTRRRDAAVRIQKWWRRSLPFCSTRAARDEVSISAYGVKQLIWKCAKLQMVNRALIQERRARLRA